jgi:class 3 adenylate cyclase
MTVQSEPVLERCLTQVEGARAWSPRTIAKLEALIRGDEAGLYRVNPLAFGADRGIESAEAIDLFLHSTRAGLFRLQWDVLCPQSGMVVDSFAALRTLRSHYVCGLCDIEGDTNLDDFIEVTFTLAPEIRALAVHSPERLSAEDYHWRYRFSGAGRLPGGQRFLDVLPSMVRALTFLPPGETTVLRAHVQQGALSGVNVQSQAGFAIPVDPKAAPSSVVRVRWTGARFEHAATSVPPGDVVIEAHNAGPTRAPLMVINWPMEIVCMEVKPQLDFGPLLTGGALLAKETFRRLYRSERIDDNEGLGVKQVTFLFTDLKGSTKLYSRLGDLNAYALVREHFGRLFRVVVKHDGAVVKTIGDAVMAAFARPADAVKAGLEMLTEIRRLNAERGSADILLKVGLHCGPSIAVTSNESLDYFGQTVNIAARVQALADYDEVYLSETLYSMPGVPDLLSGWEVAASDAHLKGIDEEVHVYRVRSASGGA